MTTGQHNYDDLSPLEDGMDRYLHLIESSTGGGGDAYIYSQIDQALSHNRIYNGFADILASSAAQAALNKEDDANGKATSTKHTLELFAFGTIDDYVTKYNSNSNTEDNTDRNYYLDLTEKQVSKLRRLSVVSLVRKLSLESSQSQGKSSPRTVTKNNPSKFRSSTIPYAALMRELHLDISVGGAAADAGVEASTYKYAALEKLLTECIYNRLLVGGQSHKLDQKRKCLHVLPCPSANAKLEAGEVGVTRDVNVSPGAGDIDRMAEQLKHLIQQSGSVIATLQGISSQSKQHRDNQQMVWAAVQKTLEENEAGNNERNAAGGDEASSSAMGGMDFATGGDGAAGGGGGNSRRESNARRSKRRHPGAFLGGNGGNFRS